MKHLVLYQAQPIANKRPHDINISITKNTPIKESLLLGMSLKNTEKIYCNEAALLYDALTKSLPQGTIHQLLILLLKHKVNLLIGI
ncbi:hypothetical protein KAR91_48655 [Candidatus Pacearchaeota archaeon]|nr:hypothetical protein [Candidatus Pacearchaeota archaeon]